jgi:ectoine hydroxylase-related dioxygenase (phytanoyl-CoA dioxygenase family)
MTAIDPTQLPTAADVAHYHEHGWYISPALFDDDALDRAIDASEVYYAGLDRQLIDLPNQRTYNLAWWHDTGADKLRKNDYTTPIVPELDALLRAPALGATAALLAGEDVRLWHDQLLFKPPSPPEAPQAVGWHTDFGYWRTCSSPNMLTAWVPFTNMDEDIGTITFIDGSHRWPENNHLNFFSSDLDGLEKQFDSGGAPVVKAPAVMRRGQVSFHHCKTIHGSLPNTTDAPRRSIALHLQPASNQYLERHHENGSLYSHPNDELTRGADGRPHYDDPVFCPVVGVPPR